MKALLLAARDVLRSGRFITGWSLALALFVSLTVMSANVEGVPRLVLLAASAAGWLFFAVALTAVGALERAVHSPRARTAVIVVGVLVAAALRPLVQDGWLLLFGSFPPPLWALPFRILTNLIVWAIVLTAVAVLVDALRSLRTTNALLASVAAEMELAHEAQQQFDGRAQDAVDDATRELRQAVAGLASAEDPSIAVARASDQQFRRWSHDLSRLAESPVEIPPTTVTLPPRPSGGVLRVPPPGTVAALYIACMLPYAAQSAEWPVTLLGLAVVLLGGGLVDAVSRHPRLRRSGPAPVILFLALSAVMGATLSFIVAITGTDPLLGMLPAVGYLALAAGCAACTGAVHDLRAEQRQLDHAISEQHTHSRTASSSTRAALRTASDLLHRDGQGACAVFVIEHRHPTPAEVLAIIARLDAVVDDVAAVFAAEVPALDAAAIDDLVGTWGRAIQVQLHCDPETRAVLDSTPAVAADVFEVVAEGLLNAVKHASVAAAEVHIALIHTGAGPRVRVQVQSLGELAGEARLRADSAVGSLGAVLRSEGAIVTLEAAIAVPRAQPSPPVVSAAPGLESHHRAS